MPDRRQHDRREGAGNAKKISISLTNFIMSIVIFIILIASIILCRYFYYKGYDDSYDENYETIYDYGYNTGYTDGFENFGSEIYDQDM